MRRRAGAAIAFVACWVALAAGCGGAAKDASPSAAAPSNMNGGSPARTESMPPGSQGYPPPPPATAPTTIPSATPGPSTAARRNEAIIELDRAERDFTAASNDCGTACRALASLERATVRLCELAAEPEDVQRCDDAKKKLRSARERVRASCTSCPGGPSVDRDAPIPSR